MPDLTDIRVIARTESPREFMARTRVERACTVCGGPVEDVPGLMVRASAGMCAMCAWDALHGDP